MTPINHHRSGLRVLRLLCAASLLLRAAPPLPAEPPRTQQQPATPAYNPFATPAAAAPEAAPLPTSVSRTVASTNSMLVLDDSRRLGVGDRLSFRIVEDGDPPIPLFITDSGEMEAPYVGRVRAVGKTCKQLGYELKALLEREYYYTASVILGLDSEGAKTKVESVIYMMGQVRSQGPVPINPSEGLTVSKAILRAGGFAEFADQRKVRLVRKNGPGGQATTQVIDVKRILDQGQMELDVPVKPDDMIIVGEKLINF